MPRKMAGAVWWPRRSNERRRLITMIWWAVSERHHFYQSALIRIWRAYDVGGSRSPSRRPPRWRRPSPSKTAAVDHRDAIVTACTLTPSWPVPSPTPTAAQQAREYDAYLESRARRRRRGAEAVHHPRQPRPTTGHVEDVKRPTRKTRTPRPRRRASAARGQPRRQPATRQRAGNTSEKKREKRREERRLGSRYPRRLKTNLLGRSDRGRWRPPCRLSG